MKLVAVGSCVISIHSFWFRVISSFLACQWQRNQTNISYNAHLSYFDKVFCVDRTERSSHICLPHAHRRPHTHFELSIVCPNIFIIHMRPSDKYLCWKWIRLRWTNEEDEERKRKKQSKSYLIRVVELLALWLSPGDSQHRMVYEKSSCSSRLNNNFVRMTYPNAHYLFSAKRFGRVSATNTKAASRIFTKNHPHSV